VEVASMPLRRYKTALKSQLFINEQSNERTANREQYNTTKEVGMKPQETMVGMMPQ
jgi:hypothetical protein